VNDVHIVAAHPISDPQVATRTDQRLRVWGDGRAAVIVTGQRVGRDEDGDRLPDSAPAGGPWLGYTLSEISSVPRWIAR
jgi:hypothetical protein